MRVNIDHASQRPLLRNPTEAMHTINVRRIILPS
jgi:hypothetical protein